MNDATHALAESGQRDESGRIVLDALVAGLDRDRREAFVLTQMLGLTYAEAAEVCGCEVGTIRSRVARGRAQLVAAVSDLDADSSRAEG